MQNIQVEKYENTKRLSISKINSLIKEETNVSDFFIFQLINAFCFFNSIAFLMSFFA